MMTRRTALSATAGALPALSAACAASTNELPGPERAALAVSRATPSLETRLAAIGARLGDPVFMRAYKREKELDLFVQPGGQGQYQAFANWPVCAASGNLGPKLAEGDRQVPEGVYGVTAEAMNHASSFHLSMNVGYPNAFDRALGRTGSFIMIHGRCSSVGCLAMTDPVIEEIWTLVSKAHEGGQVEVPVHIFPFPMSEAALIAEAGSPHLGFWQNLKAVHDAFERTGLPPRVDVTGGGYRVAG